ncbi:hypothetical protein ABTK60_20450, partial [Acinetobacter baumannii]
KLQSEVAALGDRRSRYGTTARLLMPELLDRLSTRSETLPLIRYDFFQELSDLRRTVKAVRLSRRISRTTPSVTWSRWRC